MFCIYGDLRPSRLEFTSFGVNSVQIFNNAACFWLNFQQQASVPDSECLYFQNKTVKMDFSFHYCCMIRSSLSFFSDINHTDLVYETLNFAKGGGSLGRICWMEWLDIW